MTLREFIQDSLLLEKPDGKSILDTEVAVKIKEQNGITFVNSIKDVIYKDDYIMINLTEPLYGI